MNSFVRSSLICIITCINTSAMSMKTPQSALHQCAQRGDSQAVCSLLDRQVFHVNAPNHLGQTALMQAVAYGRLTVVSLLMHKYNASCSTKDKDGKTVLHYAASKPLGSTQHCEYIAKLLIGRNGKEIDEQSTIGFTPLHTAVLSGQYAIALLLVAHGADRAITDNAGNRAYQYAQAKKLNELAKHLSLNVPLTPQQLQRKKSRDQGTPDSLSPNQDRLEAARAMLHAQRLALHEAEDDAQEDTTSKGE